jgi:hypothetical protein
MKNYTSGSRLVVLLFAVINLVVTAVLQAGGG